MAHARLQPKGVKTLRQLVQAECGLMQVLGRARLDAPGDVITGTRRDLLP